MKPLMVMIFLFSGGWFTMADDHSKVIESLPREIGGWTRPGEVSVYDPANLFEYIDGGAELYLSYGFKRLFACTYTREDRPEITVDIFDMGRDVDAFGVFSHGREASDRRIGRDSEYVGGLLTFWKGNYYVSLLSYPETEESKKAIFGIGRLISEAIAREGEYPAILSLLPPEGLVKESVRYFRHHVWINSHYFIAAENILHIDKDTEAALARYREGGNPFYVLMVAYPDRTRAEAAYAHFTESYLPDAPGGIKKIEDGKWTGGRRLGNYIAVVFNSPDREKIAALLEKVKNILRSRS